MSKKELYPINLIYNFKTTCNLAYEYTSSKIVVLYTDNNEKINKTLYILLKCIPFILFSFKSSLCIQGYITFFYYLKWFILGLLSTIGLGFGIQTGILFVLPFIVSVYTKSIECNSTDFNTILGNTFECTTDHDLKSIHSEIILKWNIFFKCLPVVLIWGLGSSIGELPPFLLAKYSKINIQEELKQLRLSVHYDNEIINGFSKISNRLLDKVFNLFNSFIKEYNFITILIVAAWPNITFDICGLMCGYYQLSLWEFLIPTIIGKVCIKSVGQLGVIIYLYSVNTIPSIPQSHIIRDIITLCIVFYFIKKCIESAAHKQKDIYMRKLLLAHTLK